MLHAIVNGIATVIMAIVGGITTFFSTLITCLTYLLPSRFNWYVAVAIVVLGAECEVRVLGILALEILALDQDELYKLKERTDLEFRMVYFFGFREM